MSARTSTPSIAELRAVTQPPSIFERNSGEHWAGRLYIRRFSPYLTRALLRTPLTPNAVTWLMLLTGVAAAGALTLPGIVPAVAAFVLIQLQILFDCSDGELAGAAALFTSWLRGDEPMTAEVDACLTRHGLPRTPADLGLTEEQFAQAAHYAPRTRPDRYTILEHLDLAEDEMRSRVRAYVDAVDR